MSILPWNRPGVELMLVVVEPTRAGITTALAVDQLAADIELPRVAFIGNKIRSVADQRYLYSSLPRERILGMLPFSETVLEKARQVGRSGFQEMDLMVGIEGIYQQIGGGG